MRNVQLLEPIVGCCCAGANMANAWLMRPGSSMIELQPYGFDEGPAHLQYPLFNMRVRFVCQRAVAGAPPTLHPSCACLRHAWAACTHMHMSMLQPPSQPFGHAAGRKPALECFFRRPTVSRCRRTMQRACSGGCCPSATRPLSRLGRTRRRGGATPPAMPRSATSCCGEIMLSDGR